MEPSIDSMKVPDEIVAEVREEARAQETVVTRSGQVRAYPRRKHRPPPPSRARYLASHPTVTLRVSAALKERLEDEADGAGKSLSRWLIDSITGIENAHVAGEAVGRREGLAEGDLRGYRRGRVEGECSGQQVGFYSGALLAGFAGKDHRPVDFGWVAQALAGNPQLAGVVRQALARSGYGEDFDRLMKHGAYVSAEEERRNEGVKSLARLLTRT